MSTSTPLESRLTISLPYLRQQGYLTGRRSGVLEWVSGNQVELKMNIDEPPSGCLLITYGFSNQILRQTIQLVQVASNLKRGGGIWYFMCPQTSKHCRKLVFDRGQFVSRYAQGGLRYRSQLWSHKKRESFSVLRDLREQKQRIALIQWISQPKSRRTYRGKPTRPMLKFYKLNSINYNGENCTSPILTQLNQGNNRENSES